MPRQNKGLPDPVRAREFAELAHAGQRYNDEVPYSTHLQAVVNVLARFDSTEPVMVCAAWLHDTIEDTGTSYNDIGSRFGSDVADLVFAVTSELGRNRKERNMRTYPKIRAGGYWALRLKLADRIANVEYGAATGGKVDMYAKEFRAFFEGLFFVQDPDAWHSEEYYADLIPMWEYLNRILGCPLAPSTFDKVDRNRALEPLVRPGVRCSCIDPTLGGGHDGFCVQTSEHLSSLKRK